MAIRLIVSMTATPGKRDELISTFRELCPNVQREIGCQQYEFFQSRESDDRFVLIEKWDDEDTLRVHMDALRARNLNLDALRVHRNVEHYVMK